MFRALHDLSKKYGPIMTVKMGTLKVVVLSRIDVVTEALVKRGADIAGRYQTFSGQMFSDGGNDIIFANYSPTWKLHRKIVSKALRQYLLGEDLGEKITESLQITAELIRKEKGPTDPFPFLSLVIFNILSGLCFDITCTSTDDERYEVYVGMLDRAAKNAQSGFIEDFIPLARILPDTNFRRMYKINREFLAAIKKDVDEHRRTFSPGRVRDFCDAVLQTQREAQEEEDPELLAKITDVHVEHTVSDVYVAGINTSRQSLRWCLLVLAVYPEIQRKVQEEVDQVIGPDLVVSLSDRDQLPYTEAVLYETLRYRSVAPIGIPHVALCDTTVGGYDIPKGTMVMINHHALHFDPDQWGDVEAFRPERFLDDSGKMAPKPESWLPFSAGRRVCLGETVAKPELHLILAGLARAFHMSVAPGEKADLVPGTKGPINDTGPYKILMTPRD